MSDGTKIEWTDATVNAVNGCSVISPGCTNCYAMRLAGTRLRDHPSRKGLTIDSKAGPVWNGEIRVIEKAMLEPLSWKRPRAIFWNAHGDLFHDAVPDEAIDRCFAVMALTPHHKHQVLTKRSARMREYMSSHTLAARLATAIGNILVSSAGPRALREMPIAIDCGMSLPARYWPLPNVWLGVSVEDQQRADERIPDLLATPAAIRFLSCEPLLGPVSLEPWLDPANACQGCDDGEGYGNRCASDRIPRDEQCPWNRAIQVVTDHGPLSAEGFPKQITCEVMRLDWVIVGGESGPGARPMHPAWAQLLRDQCAAADVPFLFKQWGEWAPVSAIDENVVTDEQLYHARLPKHLPEGPRRCKVEQLVMQASGRIFPMDEWSQLSGEDPAARDFAFAAGKGAMTMMKIGKRAAGRLLDGVRHDGMPA